MAGVSRDLELYRRALLRLPRAEFNARRPDLMFPSDPPATTAAKMAIWREIHEGAQLLRPVCNPGERLLRGASNPRIMGEELLRASR